MKSDGCSEVTTTQGQKPLKSLAELSEDSVREGGAKSLQHNGRHSAETEAGLVQGRKQYEARGICDQRLIAVKLR